MTQAIAFLLADRQLLPSPRTWSVRHSYRTGRNDPCVHIPIWTHNEAHYIQKTYDKKALTHQCATKRHVEVFPLCLPPRCCSSFNGCSFSTYAMHCRGNRRGAYETTLASSLRCLFCGASCLELHDGRALTADFTLTT